MAVNSAEKVRLIEAKVGTTHLRDERPRSERMDRPPRCLVIVDSLIWTGNDRGRALKRVSEWITIMWGRRTSTGSLSSAYPAAEDHPLVDKSREERNKLCNWMQEIIVSAQGDWVKEWSVIVVDDMQIGGHKWMQNLFIFQKSVSKWRKCCLVLWYP